MDVTSVQRTANSTTTSANQTNKASGSEDFLKLLTTQMSHQDPLNPMDNAQFTSQLTQFSQLEQLTQLNAQMNTMTMAQTAALNASMVSFIGKDVEAVGNSLAVSSAGQSGSASSVDLKYDWSGSAKDVTVEVYNSKGELKNSLKVGDQNSGTQHYQLPLTDLEGKPLPEGEYSYVIKGQDQNGQEIKAKSYVDGRVSGISYDKGYPELLLQDGRIVAVGDITQVREQTDKVQSGDLSLLYENGNRQLDSQTGVQSSNEAMKALAYKRYQNG
jgi:flagellar basal-body rod modification protein FlgD